MTLEQFIEHVSDRAEEIFRRTGRLLPMYHMVCRDGKHFVTEPPHRDKDTSVAMVKALFEMRDVVRYVFMDEAWTVEKPSEAELQRAKELAVQNRLSEHPDRIEIVMFNGEDEGEGLMMGRRDIIRGRGKPKLGPLKIDRFPQSEGRMVGLLPKRGRVQ